jgi:mono/diheme cytochrome c family protein
MRGIMAIALLAAVGCGSRSEPPSAVRARKPGIRVSMDQLHRMGGVPAGWKLSPPPGDVAAGRQAFVDFGCYSCHVVKGESFSAKASGTAQVGPELTGMGLHHPPAYFAEAIMNPDAVLIEGPGYIGPDGHSVMPDYPEMTLQQLGDLVAYLSSLRSGDPHAAMMMAAAAALAANQTPRAAPPPAEAKMFLAQSYDITTGKLGDFEQWFKDGGAKRLLAFDGIVSIETYADFTRERNPYTSVFGFRDAATMQRLLEDPAFQAVGAEFDGFIGDHNHVFAMSPQMYRVPSLSAP